MRDQKFKCIIVEDEPIAAGTIENFLLRNHDFQIIGKCSDAVYASNLLSTQDVDLMFLDLNLPVIKGFDFLKRIKNVSYMLLPLIFSSIEKIDIISNAMLLRGFGKKDKRTWYYARKIENKDYIAILITAVFIVISIVLIKINNGRFFNPFIQK